MQPFPAALAPIAVYWVQPSVSELVIMSTHNNPPPDVEIMTVCALISLLIEQF